MMNVSKRNHSLKDSILYTIQANATLLTGFITVLIVVSGVSLINDPTGWWIPALSIGSLFVALFLLINARVFIKAIVTIFSLLLMSSLALQIGFIKEPMTSSGFSWMMAILAIALMLLSISYIRPSGRGRWGTLLLSSIIGFIGAYSCVIADVALNICVVIGSFLTIGAFLLLYYVFGKTRYSKSSMPQPALSEGVLNTLTSGLLKDGWKTSILHHDDEAHDGQILAWKDDRAYLLYPVRLENSLTLVGRGKVLSLGHRGKSLNPWLLNIYLNKIPSLRTKNAPIIPVLLDVRNTNGSMSKVIGASMDDTKKILPALITPSLSATRKLENVTQLMSEIDTQTAPFRQSLSQKHLKSLEKFSHSAS